jgi:hypothetical protein
VVVWDNLNAHVSAAMAKLIAARDWLTVCRLPAYAHELNPVERVWSVLKRSLANLVKRDIGQLTALARTRLRRMQYRPGLLEGFLAGTGLDLTPFNNPHHLKSLVLVTSDQAQQHPDLRGHVPVACPTGRQIKRYHGHSRPGGYSADLRGPRTARPHREPGQWV